MHIKWQTAALLLLAAFLLGLLLSTTTSTTNTGHNIHEKEVVRARFDTAYTIVAVKLSPIHASGVSNRTKTIIHHDTIFKTPCLDTILVTDTSAVSPDTISVCYAPIADSFNVSLRLAARKKEVRVPYIAMDTFIWRSDSIHVSSSTERKWYDEVLMVIVSIAAGIILSKL
jgi:hypothetical protein